MSREPYVEDGMGFAGLVPTAREKQEERREKAKARYIVQLESDLASERARRIKAEEVVDAAILMPFELNRMDETPTSHELAEAYRAQYPRAEKEKHK